MCSCMSRLDRVLTWRGRRLGNLYSRLGVCWFVTFYGFQWLLSNWLSSCHVQKLCSCLTLKWHSLGLINAGEAAV
ncbi:hypothetical protein M6B38_326975 [Iris pallida]|uniref:Uncharacterized protein n=1 Tax=Iris pallida TaxID=29817 RepID=A0AAX6H6E4_IRIPA|nr:hypothetical protein M6B38_326975 [Iris pallida]